MDRTGGSKDEKGQENQLKFVLIGDSGVGKTTMINSYISQTPEKFTNPTVGSMFFSKKLFVDGKEYNLQIWDTAGQEKLGGLRDVRELLENGPRPTPSAGRVVPSKAAAVKKPVVENNMMAMSIDDGEE